MNIHISYETKSWVGQIGSQSKCYCKFDETQSYNWYKNVNEYTKCVRVLYRSIQTSTCSSKTQNDALANQMFNPGVKCINWYAKSYNKDHKR